MDFGCSVCHCVVVDVKRVSVDDDVHNCCADYELQ